MTALVNAKLALSAAMADQGLSNVELGRRLGVNEKAIRRLRDLKHRSHIGKVDAALRQLGKRLAVDVV